MSTIIRLLEVPPYRDGIETALQLGPRFLDQLKQSMAGGKNVPSEIDEDKWNEAVKALKATYQVGLSESFDEARSDLESNLELSPDEVSALTELISENADVSQAFVGRRTRDRFLPNLIETSLSVDLQVIDSLPEGEVAVAPVVTARFEFDEHLAGQDAISFRIPLDILSEIPDQIAELKREIQGLASGITTISVPEWARPGEQE